MRHAAQRASFAMYASGILGEGERKSVEPIAARACGKQFHEVDATHQRLLHFIGPAQWSDSQVRLTAARYALKAMTQRGPVVSAIVDDTGFLKQGHHSVGVKRQYTGSAGKVTNCQVAVSLTLATQTDHVPVDMQLYLPDTWANDPEALVTSPATPEQIDSLVAFATPTGVYGITTHPSRSKWPEL